MILTDLTQRWVKTTQHFLECTPGWESLV